MTFLSSPDSHEAPASSDLERLSLHRGTASSASSSAHSPAGSSLDEPSSGPSDSDSSSSFISIESYSSSSPSESASASASSSSSSTTTQPRIRAQNARRPRLSVPSDEPLASRSPPSKSTWQFDPLDYAPVRNPVGSRPAPRWIPPHERELGDEPERQEREREELQSQRVKQQRVLDETGAAGDPGGARQWRVVEWETNDAKGKRKGKRKASRRCDAEGPGTETHDLHDASFFPFPQLGGLKWLRGVFVTVGGGNIDFYRCPTKAASSTSKPKRPKLIHLVRTRSSTNAQDPNREGYLTCAWSVNTTTWPFTPMLAVAGLGRVIEIYLIARETDRTISVHLDRTITGHGGTIYQVAFHPQRPHLMLSCSEDRTIRLWDPTLPWGSDEEVRKVVKREMKDRAEASKKAASLRKKKLSYSAIKKQPQRPSVGIGGDGGKWTRMRPRVEGELLALLTGHDKSVFTAGFHPIYPLVVTGGADARIKVFHLPPSLFSSTPTWPTPPLLYQHPPPPPADTLVHPPAIAPFFSTIHFHPGQWPTQVAFVDSPSHSVSILSVAPLTHRDASTSPRTSIKLSTLDCLSVLPNKSSFDPHLDSHDISRCRTRSEAEAETNEAARARGRGTREPVPLKPRLPDGQTDDLGFRVDREIILEGTNSCVGDRIGIGTRGPFRDPSSSPSSPSETILAVPSIRRPPRKGRDVRADADDTGALYFFRPFPPPCRHSFATGSTTHPEPTDATRSIERDEDGRLAARVAHLFPRDRDRTLHDFHPRLRPFFISDYPPPRPSRSRGDDSARTFGGESADADMQDDDDDDYEAGRDENLEEIFVVVNEAEISGSDSEFLFVPHFERMATTQPSFLADTLSDAILHSGFDVFLSLLAAHVAVPDPFDASLDASDYSNRLLVSLPLRATLQTDAFRFAALCTLLRHGCDPDRRGADAIGLDSDVDDLAPGPWRDSVVHELQRARTCRTCGTEYTIREFFTFFPSCLWIIAPRRLIGPARSRETASTVERWIKQELEDLSVARAESIRRREDETRNEIEELDRELERIEQSESSIRDDELESSPPAKRVKFANDSKEQPRPNVKDVATKQLASIVDSEVQVKAEPVEMDSKKRRRMPSSSQPIDSSPSAAPSTSIASPPISLPVSTSGAEPYSLPNSFTVTFSKLPAFVSVPVLEHFLSYGPCAFDSITQSREVQHLTVLLELGSVRLPDDLKASEIPPIPKDVKILKTSVEDRRRLGLDCDIGVATYRSEEDAQNVIKLFNGRRIVRWQEGTELQVSKPMPTPRDSSDSSTPRVPVASSTTGDKLPEVPPVLPLDAYSLTRPIVHITKLPSFVTSSILSHYLSHGPNSFDQVLRHQVHHLDVLVATKQIARPSESSAERSATPPDPPRPLEVTVDPAMNGATATYATKGDVARVYKLFNGRKMFAWCDGGGIGVKKGIF
ncbi:hypothetical protein JCM11491_005654 [Sporobolomyces phaffii]